VSHDDRQWFLLNASPDIRAQLESFPALHPALDPGGGRTVPLRAVLLPAAELDHTLGLLLLREGHGLEIHTTKATRETLYDGTSLLRTLEAYCPVEWRQVVPGADARLADGLSYRAFDVPTTKRARFGAGGGEGRVVGYRLTDERTGGTLVYLPSMPNVEAVRDELNDFDCLLVDGTCWQDDEMVRLGLAAKTARTMGHLPISGQDGSLAQLAALPGGRKIYIHINNTNPILLEDSPERRIVEQHGIEVADDGLELQI
jgi:pyrroloquinoline quinone biosynthesis protein B